MTVSTTTSRVSYPGTGSAGPFGFSFKIFAAGDLRVVRRSATGVDTTLDLTDDYTLSGVGNRSGGYVTLTTPLATGETLILTRDLAITQQVSLRTQGDPFFPEVVEDGLDRLTMIAQQHERLLDRALVLPDTSTADGGVVFPAAQGGHVAVWNAAGTALVSVPISSVAADGSSIAEGVFTVSATYGDGATDATAAIQAAIDAAQAVGGVVYLPSGDYRIFSALTFDPAGLPIVVRGENRSTTFITVDPTADEFHALFDLPDAQLDGFQISDLRLDGRQRVEYCIYAPRWSHGLLRRLDVRYSTVCGIGLAYGWCNEIENCRIWLHDGDGVHFMANLVGGINGNNALRVRDSKIYANGGCGIKLWYGYSVVIAGCTLEGNKQTGIYLFQDNFGVVIRDNYFEANAEDGLVFTDPSVTVRADVVINGSDGREGLLLDIQPARAITVDGNLSFTNHVDGFVWANSAQGLSVRQNYAPSVPAVLTLSNATVSSLGDVDIAGNQGVTKPFGVLSYAPWIASDFADVRIAGVPQTNLWPQAVGDLDVVLASGGGSITQSLGRYNGWPAVELTGATATDAWGVLLDMFNYPELAGRMVLFAAMVQGPATAGGHLYCDAALGPTYSVDPTSYTFGSTAWRLQTLLAEMPASGPVQFGVRKSLGGSGDVVVFSRLVLVRFGAGYANAETPVLL